MSNDIAIYNERRLTYFQKKRREIKNEIKNARNSLRNAKNNFDKVRNEYYNTPWYRPFKRAQLKKEYCRAQDNLIIAHSEALIQLFKILGYILAFLVLALALPADAIIKTRNWVAEGFENNNENMTNILKTMTAYNQNKRPQKSGINISKGLSRLFRVCIVVAIIIFGFQKIWMHNKNTATTTTTTTSQVTSAENIEALKNRMVELKSSINTLKENFFGSSDTDEEIYFEAIDQDDNPESKNELSSEEIANTEVNQTTPENLEQKTVADENKTETADTNSQTEASAEPSGQTNNE